MDSSINFNEQLLNAVLVGDVDKVEICIQAGANIEAINRYGYTSLMLAACKNSTAVVAQLIAAHANIEAADQYGRTALMAAAQRGHTAVVVQLIEAHANIEATDQYGNTALRIAARKNHPGAAFCILRAMSPASRAAIKPETRTAYLPRIIDFWREEKLEGLLAIRYQSMASDFERQVCEIYRFFSHSSRPMTNPVLGIMLRYLQAAEWLLHTNMEAEIRLASETVQRQEAEALTAQAPVAVTFMNAVRGALCSRLTQTPRSASADERKKQTYRNR